MNIGEKIKEARLSKGWTQVQLADAMGVNRSTIANYEISRRVPAFEDVKKLSELLNVNIDFFVGNTDGDQLSDFLARANAFFNNKNINTKDKDLMFQDIMKMYMNNK